MSRRRLQIVCSSDEEDNSQPQHQLPPQAQNAAEFFDDDIEMEIEESTHNFQSVTLNSADRNPIPSSNVPSEPIHLDISDDDVDVTEPSTNFIPAPQPNVTPPAELPPVEVSDCGVSRILQGLGLRLRREWLESCLRGLERSVQGFSRMDDSAKTKLCFGQFLNADMNWCGAGVLPQNVCDLHSVDLKGPFVLQVDEIINISCQLRGRYQNAAPGLKRCLKLSMTDGIQRVFGMEYRPIKDLDVLAPAGMKVTICNVNVRHGLFMLVPEVLEVLGGIVEELEAARQRVVNEVNKPPRGKRTRNGVPPPLATRASLAAWPPENSLSGCISSSSAGVSSTIGNISSSRNLHAPRSEPSSAQGNINSTRESMMACQVEEQGNISSSGNINIPRSGSISVQGNIFSAIRENMASNQVADQGNVNSSGNLSTPRSGSISVQGNIISARRENMASNQVADQGSAGTAAGIHSSFADRQNVPMNISEEDFESYQVPAMDVEEVNVIDETKHPFILEGDKETPFTYLASLSAKWTSVKEKVMSIQGKIKCFLTGVKGFQYKQRTTYELRAYIDDGSLISEILIDHNVVLNGIGHSPQEVTAALASSNGKEVSNMKEKLKQFQKFLVNFEGTMLIQINEASPVPVAIEMNQGCPASDAWLILKRLKPSSHTGLIMQQTHLNPINLSP